ncbi:DUF350 domain-containing protein [Rhizohabitans arisaemae]|uniref:DUF350 domain-containing protein n=1 Tax=Rhizohabitans arisaemae TaxID=2720610 RepID=UPI0024B0C9FE|nr:DUF350 domain-containing protein [Rhizohabitans arisaemae]
MVLESMLGEVLARGALAIVAYAALGLVLLIVGFFAVDLATPGRLSKIISVERNPNATLIATSGLVAIGLIVAASIYASGGTLLEGLLATLVFGLVGIIAQTVAAFVFDKVLGFDLAGLIRNPELQPATRLLAATHVVLGIITAVAVI